MSRESYASVHKDHAGLFLMLSYDYNPPIGSRGVVAIYRGELRGIMEKATTFIKDHKNEEVRSLTESEIAMLVNS